MRGSPNDAPYPFLKRSWNRRIPLNCLLIDPLITKLDTLQEFKDGSVPEIVSATGINPEHDLIGLDFRGIDFKFAGIGNYDLSGCDLRGAQFCPHYGYPKGYKSAVSDDDNFADDIGTLVFSRLSKYFSHSNAIERVASLAEKAPGSLSRHILDQVLEKISFSGRVTKLEIRVIHKIKKVVYAPSLDLDTLIASKVCETLIQEAQPFQRLRAARSLSKYIHNDTVERSLKRYYFRASSDQVLYFLSRILS